MVLITMSYYGRERELRGRGQASESVCNNAFSMLEERAFCVERTLQNRELLFFR